MYQQIASGQYTFFLFILVLIRCSGMVVFAPFFGSTNFPRPARIGLAVLFTLPIFTGAIVNANIPATLGLTELSLLVLQELSIGLFLGFLASIVFMGAQLAGQLIGMQIGFAMANVIDPQSGTQVSLIGFFKMHLATLLFLVMGLHLVMLDILYKSFSYVPIGNLAFDNFAISLPGAAILHSNAMFVIALKLATPVLLVMLLNSTIEGFVTRTMPQMNIMVLGLPLRVTLGLGVLVLIIPTAVQAMTEYLLVTVDNVNTSARAFNMPWH